MHRFGNDRPSQHGVRCLTDPDFKIGKTTEAYVLPYKHSDPDMSHKIMFFFVAGVLEIGCVTLPGNLGL